MSSVRWRYQTTWFVDPAAGHDENTGLVGSPIKTLRELSRRLGAAGEVPATIDITIGPGDIPATDTFLLRFLLVRPNAMIRVHGTPTELDNGTFTAVTDLNSGTQTPPSVTDGVQNFGAYNNRRMRIVGGPRDGAIAFISLIQSATTVRTSAWATNNVSATPYNPAVTLVNPQVGDAYVIESLPILPSWESQLSKTSQGTQGAEVILFESLKLGNSSNDRFNTGDTNTSISKCVIDVGNFYGRDQHISLSNFIGNTTYHISTVTLRACLKKGGILNAHHPVTFFMRDQTMGQGVAILNLNNGALADFIGPCACFDSSTDGITVDMESQLRLSALLWGNNNTQYGIRCDGHGEYAAASKPTITGLVGDTRIGGVDFAYASIPSNNLDNLAELVVRPV